MPEVDELAKIASTIWQRRGRQPPPSAHSTAVEAELRLYPGFGTYENVVLLIEIGYDLYTNPQSYKIVFAANFIRWAAHWLQAHTQPAENTLHMCKLSVKRQVHLAVHASVQVSGDSAGKLLKFSKQSAFAG